MPRLRLHSFGQSSIHARAAWHQLAKQIGTTSATLASVALTPVAGRDAPMATEATEYGVHGHGMGHGSPSAVPTVDSSDGGAPGAGGLESWRVPSTLTLPSASDVRAQAPARRRPSAAPQVPLLFGRDTRSHALRWSPTRLPSPARGSTASSNPGALLPPAQFTKQFCCIRMFTSSMTRSSRWNLSASLPTGDSSSRSLGRPRARSEEQGGGKCACVDVGTW